MANQVISSLEIKDGASTTTVDLGASASNVTYGNSSNVSDALDGKLGTKVQADNFYGTCATAAATAAKTVTLTAGTNFTLRAGVEVLIKCTYTNSANNPTLNVAGTGAKSIWYNTAAITTSSVGVVTVANRYIKYVYDGTYWVWCGQSIDNNTTYSVVSKTANGLCPKLPDETTTTKYLRQDGTWVAPGAGVTQVSTGVGLTGGDITSTGTVKAKLKSETASSLTAADKGSTTNREYAVGVDASGNLSVNILWTDNNDNNKVTQTATSTSANYEVLFSSTADNTTRTEGARKNSNLLFNPNTGNLQATQLNGVAIGSSPKFTDTTYSLVGANGTTGLIKNGSTVTSASGYTACPIISGVPYYKDTNTTTGDGIKTKVAQTGTAGSAITSTIAASTTMDNAIATLLNNDATLNSNLANIGVIVSSETYTGTIPEYGYCPKTITLPAGRWLITTYGYVSDGTTYHPFGLGLNNEVVTRGLQPTWFIVSDGTSTIYIWNLLGTQINAYNLTIEAISLK